MATAFAFIFPVKNLNYRKYLFNLPEWRCPCHFRWTEKTAKTIFIFCILLIPSTHCFREVNNGRHDWSQVWVTAMVAFRNGVSVVTQGQEVYLQNCQVKIKFFFSKRMQPLHPRIVKVDLTLFYSFSHPYAALTLVSMKSSNTVFFFLKYTFWFLFKTPVT